MVALLLALIGLPAGLALDALAVRLAVPFDAEDEAELDEEEQEAPAAGRTPAHAEAGSLVVHDKSERAWARRLLIVAAAAGLFAVAGARYDEPGHLALVTAYICVLLVCAATDLLTYRVPNAVTYPAIAGAFAVGATMPDTDLVEVVVGGAVAAGVLFLPALFTGGVGIGMGDVKLAAFVGLALGFVNVVPALLFMALSGGLAAALLLVTRARKRGEPIPYAPFISAGALVALLWQGTAFVDLT